MALLLAIDSSCDETAVSLFDLDQFIKTKIIDRSLILSEVVSSQIKLHQVYGGVVPELAAREHLLNLSPVLDTALREAQGNHQDIGAIAVTRGPGLNGCLLVGFCYAKSFCYSRNIPFFPLNHIEGHLFASELESPDLHQKYPAIALIVSGGHTTLLHIKAFRDYEIIAQTRDDAAGEAFDKCATVIGLSYPGGPNLSKIAIAGDRNRYQLPIGMPNDNRNFSFSGLKTAVVRLVHNLKDQIEDDQVRADVCASVQEAIVTALISKTMQHVRHIRPYRFVLAGGVAANTELRSRFKNELNQLQIPFVVPEHHWCTDNASMIGALALSIIRDEMDSSGTNDFNVVANKYSVQNQSKLGSLPRWPINKLFTM